jgi:hypothetical protein
MKDMYAFDPRELSDSALDVVCGGAGDGMTADASDFSFATPAVLPSIVTPGSAAGTIVPVPTGIYYSESKGSSTKVSKVKVQNGKGRRGQRHRLKGDDMTRAR